MFSRKFRLPAQASLTNSRFYSVSSFFLRLAKNTLQQNRYGFIVSKKVDMRATARNEVKRRFRSAVEQLHAHVPQGYDFLFILKKDATKKSCEQLQKEIEDVLQKSGITG